PASMACRDALALATRHGAHCLGRADEIGSLEVGKRADVALWRLRDPGAGGGARPGAAPRVRPPRRGGGRRPAAGGRGPGGAPATGSETAIAADAARASRRLQERAAA